MKYWVVLSGGLALLMLCACATTDTTTSAPIAVDAAPAAEAPAGEVETAVADADESDDRGMVCTRERVKGSLIPRRVCSTEMDRRNQEENAERDRQTLRRAPVWNSPGGG